VANFERERVPVFFAGEKVGTATMDNMGTVSMVVNSPILAKRFELGITEHIQLVPKNKEK
jgi:hypothetical protein